ncbi:DUF669 domain-containing protein [Lacticaseibacillus sp. 53-4]|uniref:DUF669 domain-containing protein n=1 Tax=Lacticaseibacillus sp. 53-4 TaxID=2799575 RepID=UPI001942DCB8|nr:DUF669 domain-containing protein [Lacticaseibacillus sp. 53-4]
MSLFTVNSNNVFGAGVSEAGTYNVFVSAATVHQSKAGNAYISADFQVLDGKYKGGEVRYQNITWDENNREVSEKRFNTIAVAIGAQDGVVIESIQQFAQAILGKKLSVDVDWGEPNEKGNVYLEVKGYHKLSTEGSKPNGVRRPGTTTHASINPAAPTPDDDPFPDRNKTIDISDDDLPF